jgi:hypothetical protein
VVKIVSSVDVQVPSFVVLPAGVYVEGKVYSASGPLGQATVTLNMSVASAVVNTTEDGQFNATLNMPLNAVFAGAQDLNVDVAPVEPWQASAQVKTSVFIVNSVNLGLASTTFVCFGFIFYFKGRKPKFKEEKKNQIAALTALPESRTTIIEKPLKPEFKLEGNRGKVLKAYLKALSVVELASNASLEPQMTLREFLQKTKPKLQDTLSAFTELTTLSEKALYSPHIPDSQDITKAESLAATIVEVLQR